VAWVLTRGLGTVRAEFNSVFPDRDKTSDGTIGDQAHQTSASGHNPDRTGRAEYKDGDSLDEVRAIDVDRDLVPGSGTDWMELVVQHLVRKARAGGYIPFRYIIYKGRIWSRTDGWRTRTYTGANKHNKHAHFSGDYTQTADNWTGLLGLASVRAGSGGDVLDAADKTWLRAEMINAAQSGVSAFFWSAYHATRQDVDPYLSADDGDKRAMRNARDILRAVLGGPVNESTILGAILAQDGVDEDALAAALAPKLNVTKDAVAAAFREVLIEGVGAPPA